MKLENHEGDWRRDQKKNHWFSFFILEINKREPQKNPLVVEADHETAPWNLHVKPPLISGISIAMEVWMVTCLLMFTYLVYQ